MKIGFVLDDGLNKPDGVQQYILTLGTWLMSQGHEVRYLVGETSRNDISGVYSLARNLKVKFNGNAMTIPLLSSKKAIKDVLAKEKFDVLHIQVPYSPFFGARVVAHADKKTAVVGTFHILPYGLLSFIGTWLLGKWLKLNLRRFDRIISVSEPASDFARKTFGIKTDVIPNAVDISKFQAANSRKSSNIRILFVGRLVARKGVAELLQALKILLDSGELPGNVSVDICGTGELRSKLERYVNKSGLTEFVHFHGFVTEEDKIKYMQQADIAIFPSLSGESFGIVLIEAMAAGSQVVLGGDNPGYRSVLEKVPGSIVPAYDVSELQMHLGEYIHNPQMRTAMHGKQQQHVKQFDVNIVGTNIVRMYQACKKARAS